MATITITTTVQQDARIAAAFGQHLMLEGNASVAQVRAFLIERIKEVVLRYEHNQAAASVTPIDVQ
jgi:hypothetical protein